MNNNENWQGNPRRSGSNAGRDGKPYEKRDVKSFNSGSRGAGRFTPSRPQNDDNSPRKLDFKKRDENYNPEQRSFNSEQRNYNSEQRGGYNSDQRSFRKPNENRPYENRGNRSWNNDRPQSDNRFQPRERFNSNDRFNNDNRGGNSYGKPRFSPNRFNQDENAPRFSVRRSGESSANQDFNQQEGRRPRFRRPSENYDPNAKYSKKKQIEYRRNEVDLSKPVRLNKFLANAGICSRREADDYIKAGVISVNGEIVVEMGVKVMHSDKVLFHNQLVRSERKVYILLNKPKDTVTTSEDTHDRQTVLDLVKNACSERIYPVGRLDRNTTGVLLLTNDGDLASKLTHPKYDKKKIYHVTLDRDLEQPDFENILSGVQLEDGEIAADALNFVKDDDLKQIGIEIHSGQNRVVRRIFEKLGYKVVRLDRVYFSGLTKKGLTRGKYRFLSEREVNMLKMGSYE